MSTILRALKKLEEDTHAESGVPMEAITRSAGRRKMRPAIVQGLIVGVVIALLGAGGFVFIRKPAPAPSSKIDTRAGASHKILKKISKPIAKRHRSITAKQMHIPEKRLRRMAAAAPPPAAAPTPHGSVTSVEKPAKPAPADVNAPPPGTGIAPPIAEHPSAALPTPAPEAEKPPVAAAPPPSAPTVSEKKLDAGAGLTLQAISWSTEAAERIAVINGKVCREGDSVGGYVIRRIDQDDVIVSNGTTSGALSFK